MGSRGSAHGCGRAIFAGRADRSRDGAYSQFWSGGKRRGGAFDDSKRSRRGECGHPALGLPNLRVVSVTPAQGATNVSRIAQIIVEFSEAINPATLLNNLRLLGTNGQQVLGSVSLNLKNTSATFLPQAQLAPYTIYPIEVGNTIRRRMVAA